MEDIHAEVFEAIKTFVEDLREVFGSKEETQLALYSRLVDQTKEDDKERIKTIVEGFQYFLSEYESMILNENYDSIPQGTEIRYAVSESICIPIQKYISSSDDETRLIIRQHLLTIGAIIDPSDEKYDELEKRLQDIGLNDGSAEGEFISGIMSKAKNTMEDTDMENPGAAMMGLLSSGVIADMVTGLQQGVGSGQMDIGKLLGSMQNAMGALMPQQEQPTIEEIEDKK